MLRQKYTDTWRTKYDLTQPAELPPMKIELKPGAKPRRIRRTYRWTPKQKEFMRKLLAKFDFVSMFWQIPLHKDSRKLFSCYAGEFGSYQFNRVAMGALNSSMYT